MVKRADAIVAKLLDGLYSGPNLQSAAEAVEEVDASGRGALHWKSEQASQVSALPVSTTTKNVWSPAVRGAMYTWSA